MRCRATTGGPSKKGEVWAMTSLSNPVLEAFLSVLPEECQQRVQKKPPEIQEAMAQQWQEDFETDAGPRRTELGGADQEPENGGFPDGAGDGRRRRCVRPRRLSSDDALMPPKRLTACDQWRASGTGWVDHGSSTSTTPVTVDPPDEDNGRRASTNNRRHGTHGWSPVVGGAVLLLHRAPAMDPVPGKVAVTPFTRRRDVLGRDMAVGPGCSRGPQGCRCVGVTSDTSGPCVRPCPHCASRSRAARQPAR